MPLLPRPSVSEIPVFEGWNLSDEEYAALQERRKVFKRLPFSRRHYTRHTGRLDDQEMDCFCAAGYFIWRLGEREAEVLMAWEDRQRGRLLNFLGGCRDTRQETPSEVAAREVDEETARLLSPTTKSAMLDARGKTVVWIPESKYALFVLELREPVDQDVHKRFAALPRPAKGGPLGLVPGGDAGIVGLEWVPASVIRENNEGNFARFAQTMIATLMREGVLPFDLKQQRRAPGPQESFNGWSGGAGSGRWGRDSGDLRMDGRQRNF